jgi:perosamine synthetase
MDMKVKVGEPWLGDDEYRLVCDAMARGEIGHFGAYVRELEELFSTHCGARFGVATSSGTAALHLSLASAGIGPGDEVIVPALTMIATANAVRYTGARTVFDDVDRGTWTLDPAAVARLLTQRTRAVLPVHLYGHPCDMDGLAAVLAGRDVLVVEDAAEAHGAEYRGRRAGSLGDVAAFSFYLNKVITTGEGGMVVTDDPMIAAAARSLRDQAFEPEARFVHRVLGFNYRMMNLQAALGVAQVRRIGELVQRKRQNAARYRRLLAGVPGLHMPPEASWATSVFWMFAILVTAEFGIDRDALIAALADRGIETRAFFVPLHRQPLYASVSGDAACPVAERLSAQGLYLPSGTGLTFADIDLVVEAIGDIQRSVR